jgi:hypothetical protein
MLEGLLFISSSESSSVKSREEVSRMLPWDLRGERKIY